ncbi:MAG TPA: hypothetical protein VHO72_15775 [Bacteroidales bacterium]|nr:hypothetical protein [Bacteroidales bacterium]
MSPKVLAEFILTFRRIAKHIPDLTPYPHFQIILFLADFRKVSAKFRRINNYIPGFRQSQDSTKYQVLSTKKKKTAPSRQSEPILSTQPHFQIFKLAHFHISSSLHHFITSSPNRHIAVLAHRRIGTSSYRHIVSLTLLLSLTPGLKAQLLTPLSNEMNRRVEYEMIQNGTPFFTVMKPYTTPKSPEGDLGESRDSVNFAIDTSAHRHIGTLSHRHTGTLAHRSWFHRKLFHESLIEVDSGNFYLYADPVFEFGLGRETSGRNTYINSRGLRAGGRLGKYVAFGTEFYENQGIFNSAFTNRVRKTMVAPGEGMVRKYDSTGFDFAHSSGYISINPLKKLNIVLAQGRQFIGDGYRSMLLSDASYTYPYLKFTWTSDKFFYAWDYILLQDWGIPMAGKKTPLRRKSATIHTIGYNLKNKIQVALVKMQLYNNPDSFGDYKIRFNQLNPILIPGMNDKNSHAIWGVNIKISPLPNVWLYNQWAFDNLFSKETKRVSLQVGAKYYASIGSHLFYFQAEYNRVPPLTYTSGNKIYNWLHLREPLAHPYGHNFDELVFIATWSYKRLQLCAQANVAKQLESITDTKPYTQATLPYYPNNKKLNYYKAEISYIFNPKTLLNISVGYNYRNEQHATEAGTKHYVYLSFGTRLFNKYYDF